MKAFLSYILRVITWVLFSLSLSSLTYASPCNTQDALSQGFKYIRSYHSTFSPHYRSPEMWKQFKKLIKFCPELSSTQSKKSGNTLFMAMAYHGSIKGLEFLAPFIKKPFQVNQSLKDVTFSAINKDNQHVLEFLWNSYPGQIELEKKDINGDTALTYAGFQGSVKSAVFLISKGANLEATDHEGFNVLLSAIMNKQPIDHLINHAINFNHTNHYGWSALMTSIHFEYKDAFDLLMAKAKNLDLELSTQDPQKQGYTAFLISMLTDDLYYAKKLLAKGADKEVKNTSGDTALLLAMEKNKDQHVRWLIETVRVNVNDSQSQTMITPIMKAIHKNNLSWFKLLLDHKDVDLSLKDKNGETVCYLAVLRTVLLEDSSFADELEKRKINKKTCVTTHSLL